ncbi:DUF6301 family protein [Nocardia pseudobrasiliensis]|uniref:Uncharacterized protein n=1 Tax=Nocardia pseudobrasiliensis TaxID=45979 RepID=A0A370I4R6_9NOCA|nr:DUF6301 family protein [Nocardia pseudobrasiliensis]RDI65733.1 hypothetical protein DFR76_10548 [Nocardia pseudobrasiliensis]
MQRDIERAAQIVRAASEFEWAWTVADLADFSDRVGWQQSRPEDRSPSLTTDLAIERTDALLYINNRVNPDVPRPLEQITFNVTDAIVNDPGMKPEIDRVFDELTQRVFEVVEKRPDGSWVEPTRGLRWDLPGIVVTVTTSKTGVYLNFISPAYQKWNDENDANLEED